MGTEAKLKTVEVICTKLDVKYYQDYLFKEFTLIWNEGTPKERVIKHAELTGVYPDGLEFDGEDICISVYVNRLRDINVKIMEEK